MKILFSLCLVWCFLSSVIWANIYFPDTSPETKVSTHYSKKQVRGKQTLTFNAYDKQTYYIYISTKEAQDGVIINFDSPLDYYIAPSEELFYLYPDMANGGVQGKKTITIKAKKSLEKITVATIQFKTKDYFLNVELHFSPYKSHGNKFVYFQNPKYEKASPIYTEKRFLELETQFDKTIAERETLMSKLLQDKSTFFPINEKIIYKQTTMTLKNLAVVNDKYMLTVGFDGDDPLSLSKQDVQLNLQPFNYSLATEVKQSIDALNLDEVISFKDENGLTATTFIFDVPADKQKKRFFLELYLTPYNVFRKKINLDFLSSAREEYLFNVDVR
tara:strand:- start:354 stop:1346 length:993 start_codon:yes stop_codon:yes gene_type:complete